MRILLCAVDGDKISREISEKNKIRLMVIPIVAMLLVTMLITGCLEEEDPIEVDVDEGYDEITVTVPQLSDKPGIEFPDNDSYRASAQSFVNGDEGFLEIEISPRYWEKNSERYLCEFNIDIQGNFSSELNPEKLILEAQVIDAPGLEENTIHWNTGYWDAEGLELWSPIDMDQSSSGEETSFIGSDIHEEPFDASVKLSNRHPSNYTFTEIPLTIEFRAVLTGHAEDVTATARVSFVQEGVESK